MREIYNYLNSQDSITDYLPGGFHYGGDVPYVSRQYIPNSFENGKLLDCALMQTNIGDPLGSILPYSVGENFSIFVYSINGTDAIDPVRFNLYDLLQYQKIPGTPGYSWQTEFVSETQGWWDDHLSAWAHVCRYRWLTNRR